MIFYRGDSRTPDKIKSTGFLARNPMSVEQAREHLLKYSCVSRDATPLDLSRWIIASPKPEYVSTAPDEGCGGYSHVGYIYKIEFHTLSERTFSDTFCGRALTNKPNMLWPSVMSDGSTLTLSNTFVLKHRNQASELTFLTAIPAVNIVAYKAPKASIFTPM